MLVECRRCSRQVSTEAENCPNCEERYPSLSEEEMQEHYSHCISCNERLLINDYQNLLQENESGTRVPEILQHYVKFKSLKRMCP